MCYLKIYFENVLILYQIFSSRRITKHNIIFMLYYFILTSYNINCENLFESCLIFKKYFLIIFFVDFTNLIHLLVV